MTANSAVVSNREPSSGSARRSSRRWIRGVVAAIGFLVLVNLVLSVVNANANASARRGPNGSSYVTTPGGLAGFEALVRSYGRSSERSRDPIGEGLESGDTAVLWDPALDELDRDSAARLAAFVRSGGRVVLATSPTTFEGLFDVGARSSGAASAPPGDARRLRVTDVAAVPGTPETVGVTGVQVRAEEAERTFAVGTRGTALLGSSERALAAKYRYGSGTIVNVATPSMLENELLDRADNARFGLSVMGPANRPIVFVERGHGFEREGEGFDAVPLGWKIALFGVLAAGLLTILAGGRRVGPPDATDSESAPPRAAYVRGLAVSLANARQPEEVFAPTQAILREGLARRLRLDDAATREQLEAGARGLGWSEDEIRALSNPVRTPRDAAAVSQAAARLGSSSAIPVSPGTPKQSGGTT